jgi:hypothetical protein
MVNLSTPNAEYLPNQSIHIESSLNALKILTDQVPNALPYDIDTNANIHIPEALYPLMIQTKMITYEIHKNDDKYYLLNSGKTFASLIKIADRTDFVIHPDACPTHYGFLWSIVPFLSNPNTCIMKSSIEKTHIYLSFFGNIIHENLLIGSFNLSMQIQRNNQNMTDGQIDIQIVTSAAPPDQTHLHLFHIQSQYLYDVPLIDPPDTRGDTGNFSQVMISGPSFNSYWIPINNPSLNKSGLSFIQVAGAKNLAVGHDLITKYPDVEIRFSSAETIYFDGQYDIKNKSNINARNVAISPYILVEPNQMYRISVSFLSNP